MTHLYNRLQFPPESRMRGIWTRSDAPTPTDDDIVLGHLIRLPGDQDSDVESDFLTSHLPFNVGGFSGVYADGSPWVFVLQVCPAAAGALVGRPDEALWVMRDAMHRALRFNHEAWIDGELAWNRTLLRMAYGEDGLDTDALTSWPVVDLVRGLLAECCYVDLSDIVAGYADGCAFPGVQHDCTGDVFTDVFQRWSLGELSVPEPPDYEDEVVDGEDDEELVVTRDLLKTLSDRQLRAVAKEIGLRTRRRKSGKWRSRRTLIDLLLENAHLIEVT